MIAVVTDSFICSVVRDKDQTDGVGHRIFTAFLSEEHLFSHAILKEQLIHFYFPFI